MSPILNVSVTGAGGLQAGLFDELLAIRDLTLTALSEQIGISLVNLSVLKNQRA